MEEREKERERERVGHFLILKFHSLSLSVPYLFAHQEEKEMKKREKEEEVGNEVVTEVVEEKKKKKKERVCVREREILKKYSQLVLFHILSLSLS